MSFQEYINAVSHGSTSIQISKEWTQGRAVFGDLVAAFVYQAMLQEIVDARPVRGLQISFVGPVSIEHPLELSTEVLRQGKSVSQILGRGVQNGQTLTSNSPKYVMPRQNPYMSSEHPMVHGQLPPTELLHLHSQQVDFKFYQDLRFHLPNGECYISITEPAMYESLAQIAAKRVWLCCLNEFLASKFFDVDFI